MHGPQDLTPRPPSLNGKGVPLGRKGASEFTGLHLVLRQTKEQTVTLSANALPCANNTVAREGPLQANRKFLA